MGETGLTDVFNPGGRFGPFPEGSRGKSGMEKKARDKGDGEGDFLGGTRSARPRGKAGRRPRHVVIMDELATGQWPNEGDVSVGVMPTLRACGARPSEGDEPR